MNDNDTRLSTLLLIICLVSNIIQLLYLVFFTKMFFKYLRAEISHIEAIKHLLTDYEIINDDEPPAEPTGDPQTDTPKVEPVPVNEH